MRFCRVLLITFVCILGTLGVTAQKTKTVSGEYEFYAPETMSLDEAKRLALEQAKIVALSESFGTVVNQSNASVISNTDGDSNVKFRSLTGSDVKGEWIENIGDPVYSVSHGDHFTSVKCKVKGRAREISGARIQYEYQILRNGKDKRFQALDFRDGDDMYMYFRSPVDGYLSVYLLDEASQTVYSILPYKRMRGSSFEIEKDRDYVLFSIDEAPADIRDTVDEYQLTCEDDKEYNTVYILFSTDKLYRGNGYTSGDVEIPDNIPFLEFRTRLGKLLATSPDVQFSQVSLTVSK